MKPNNYIIVPLRTLIFFKRGDFSMKNKYVLASIPLLIGALCLLIKNVMGETITSDGTLKEAFFLIPLSYLFFLLGILSLSFVAIKARLKKD